MTMLLERGAPPRKPTTAGAALQTAFRGVAAVFVHLHRAWKARQASISLCSLGPDMLRDIGLEPCEIDWVVRHGRPDRSAVWRAREDK